MPAEPTKITKETIMITGMHCVSCALNIERKLTKVPGVSGASVNYAAGKAHVEYDPSQVTREAIEKAIEDTGYEVVRHEQKSRKDTIPVSGMHCVTCGLNIEKTLKREPGVIHAQVNFAAGKAYVEYDPSLITLRSVERAIENAGYPVVKHEPEARSLDVRVKGPGRRDGREKAAAALAAAKGVLSHEFSPEGTLHVVFDPGAVTAEGIKTALISRGLSVAEETPLESEEALREREIRTLKNRFLFSAAFAVPLLYASMGRALGLPFPAVPDPMLVFLQFLLATPILMVNYSFYVRGFLAVARSGAANMDTLIATGTGAAYLYSFVVSLALWRGSALYSTENLYYEVAGVLIVFILLGNWLGAVAKGRTSGAIKKLIGLQPRTAVVVRDGIEREIPAEEVSPGDIVVVKPGQKVPVDGEITEGFSSIDESMVTGESIPVEKKKGETVIGGTINKSGAFHFRATQVGRDTVLAQIIKLVEEAQASKAPVQELADTVSAYFVPAVIVLASLAFLAWLLAGMPFIFALTILIAVLIIACPCALGLATPTAVMVSTGVAALNGILIKSAATMQRAEKIDAVVFDKTGTLTRGKPEVT
ncbi:MAG: heavy metal translocating P-type ATPase, partial [Endomicrobiales bacterium]